MIRSNVVIHESFIVEIFIALTSHLIKMFHKFNVHMSNVWCPMSISWFLLHIASLLNTLQSTVLQYRCTGTLTLLSKPKKNEKQTNKQAKPDKKGEKSISFPIFFEVPEHRTFLVTILNFLWWKTLIKQFSVRTLWKEEFWTTAKCFSPFSPV